MAKALKVLPCKHCNKPALLPDGKEYTLMGLGSDHRPFLYKCARCKRKNEITASVFNFLPPCKKSVD